MRSHFNSVMFIFFTLLAPSMFGFRTTDPKLKANAQQWMHEQPVRFIENKGQLADMNGKPVPFVLFKTHAPGMDMYITEQGLTYVFLKAEEKEHDTLVPSTMTLDGENKRVKWSRIDMFLKNASVKKENIIKEGKSDDFSQYFLGHCPEGITDVHTYEKITIKEIYPGIDWVFYNAESKGFKYDFVVHPGSDPKQIKLIYRSEEKLDINEQGDIQIKTSYGTLTENAPISYSENTKKNITSYFSKTKVNPCNAGGIGRGFETEIAFELATLNFKHETIIIDPQLVWATFYGGGSIWNGITALDCDQSGNVFATGYFYSASFPTANPGGGAYFQGTFVGSQNPIILKFSNTGVLIWATYYGAGLEIGNSICVDPFGNIFVTGLASSALFPVFNPGGGAYFQVSTFNRYAFILKFNNTGVRLWATVYGGTNHWNSGNSICTDPAGNVFVTGWTLATNFPVLNPGGGAYFQAAKGANAEDSFILKFSNTGVRIWATHYGGDWNDIGNSICADPNGNVFVTGSTLNGGGVSFPVLNPGGGAYFQPINGSQTDGFFLKFSNTGVLLWATHYGGAGGSGVGYTVRSDKNGNIFAMGTASNLNNTALLNPGGGAYYQPASGGIFIVKFNNAGVLLWATRYGGSTGERLNNEYDHIVIDNCNNVYVSFLTISTDVTIQNSCYTGYNDNSYNGPTGTSYPGGDGVITKFTNSGVLLWSTYFGGSGNDHRDALALDKNGNLFVGGEWTEFNGSSVNNATYPVTNPGGGAYYDATFNGGGTDYEGAFMSKFIPPTLTLAPTATASGCGCTGTATVTAAGGCVGSYNYKWYNNSWAKIGNTQNISNLCAGNYRVIVSDTINCSIDTTFVTVPASGSSLTITSVQTNVCSASCNGSATITPGGGTTPYTYLWSNGVSNQIATGLCAGAYSATITDAGSCTAVYNINIIQSPAMLLSTSSQWSCASNTATANINVANGSSPYTYLWSNTQTTQMAGGLNTGTYTITVTDKYGCTTSQTLSVNAQPLVIGISKTNIACNSGGNVNNGTLTANVSTGGAWPYTYSWSNGFTGQYQGAVGPGTYTVTITGSNGCTATSSATITSTSTANAAFTQSPNGTVCIGTTVNFTNAGTTGTYVWTLTPPAPAPAVSGTTLNYAYTFLSAGTYSISHQVTTGACTNTVGSTVIVINCSAGPTVTATGSSMCPGACATVNSSGAGGTSPYTYSWSNGSTTQNINPCPVSTSTYTVTIRDSGGSTSTSTAVVTVHPAVTVLITPTNINCSGASTGSAAAAGSGGSSPYTYNWSGGVPGTGFQVSGLSTGTYTVTITDNKGCTSTSTTTITSPPPLSGQFTKGTSNCIGCGCKEWLMVNATGGSSPYSYSWPYGYANRYKSQLCPGAYNINIVDKNGCSVNINLTTP
ncbi:MAG: SBBP repeat-containing protein [Bacteroidetes bacterium]|nr:SBBP repeat-containing protein [Bacteroidota bacterium]